MPVSPSPDRDEQKLIGRALRRLRERRSLYQGHVAAKLDMTSQAWQKYEAGERKFTPDRMQTILHAIGATRQELEDERARLLGHGPAARDVLDAIEDRPDFQIDVFGLARQSSADASPRDNGRPLRKIDLRNILGHATGALEMSGDSMVPWAEPGEVVIFDRDRYPKRGAGCVIETRAGEYFVKLYESSDGSTIFARELSPAPRIINFLIADIKGVYAVRLRGD